MPYPGRCRARGLSPAPNRGMRVVIWPGVETFQDGLLGPQVQEPAAQGGDLLLRDRLGNWTYQFAVTVDDMLHDVALVIRGEDLLPSTGRQIRLGRMLGRREPAVFLHHPLVRKRSGEKLSKASHDTGIRNLRVAGGNASAVLGEAAFRAGLIGTSRPMDPTQLAQLFTYRGSANQCLLDKAAIEAILEWPAPSTEQPAIRTSHHATSRHAAYRPSRVGIRPHVPRGVLPVLSPSSSPAKGVA